MGLLILNAAEVKQLLPMEECMAVMAEALAALAQGQVHQPLRMVVRPPDAAGLMGLMPAYLAGDQPAYGLKAICVFPGNPARGKDAHQGAVMLFDAETGEPRAMMNASAITEVRTAAVSAVATRLLARGDAEQLAIVGSGVQARAHLEAITCVRAVKRARVTSRSLAHAQAFAQEMRARYPFPVEAVESVEAAVRGADVIVTATTATDPVLRREWLSPGVHVNAVGAVPPTARELDSATVADASLFVDQRQAAMNEAGDFLIPLGEGVIGPDHIRAEIGELLLGRQPGRTSAAEITIFKSLGLAVEDVAAAGYVYRRAKMLDVGTAIAF